MALSTRLKLIYHVCGTKPLADRVRKKTKKRRQRIAARKSPAAREINASKLEYIRRAVAAASGKSPSWQQRKRLSALKAILAGSPIEAAARNANVKPDTVRGWIGDLRHDKGASLHRKDRRVGKAIKLTANSAALRTRAAQERSWRLQRRLLAIADVADGHSLADIMVRRRVRQESIANWVERYRALGAEGLRGKEIYDRPFKLKPRQMNDLRKIIVANPGVNYPALCKIVRRKFGVRYTLPGMIRLVTKTLGFTRDAGRFVAAS